MELNTNLFFAVLENAAAHEDEMKKLSDNPAKVFKSVGMQITDEGDFNTFFKEETQEMMAALNVTGPMAQLSKLPSATCAACTISAWTVATLIAAVGAGALATLTTASAPVLALASLVGCSLAAALAFIKSIGVAVAAGAGAVAKAICRWIGACP